MTPMQQCKSVYTMAYRMCRPADAEDVAQEACAMALEYAAKYGNPERMVASWWVLAASRKLGVIRSKGEHRCDALLGNRTVTTVRSHLDNEPSDILNHIQDERVVEQDVVTEANRIRAVISDNTRRHIENGEGHTSIGRSNGRSRQAEYWHYARDLARAQEAFA